MPRRGRARPLVPRTAVRTQPLQHLEVSAARHPSACPLVPRCVVLAQDLQLLELSAPRRCMAQVCLIPQYTSSLQALHRAQTSDLYGFILIELHKPKPRRRHRAAHRGADHSEPCEIGGVVEILRSQHVSDEDVVEKARDDLARVSIALALSLTRAGFHTERRVVGHRDTRRVSRARGCASGLPRKALQKA